MRTLLTGLSEWQWLGAFMARLVVGLLFFLSGRGKLFVPERREQMREALVAAGIPFASINAIFVSTVELVFGLLLILGALTPLACAMLGGVMVVAIATTTIKNIKPAPLLGRLSEFLYLPEVLYLVILFWVFLSGPGWLSVDQFVFKAHERSQLTISRRDDVFIALQELTRARIVTCQCIDLYDARQLISTPHAKSLLL
jgi:putative oxidoreductase